MTNWADLKHYAHEHYEIVHDEEERMGLIFRYGDGRSQQIYVTRFVAFEEPFVELRTAVCKEDEMAPKNALRRNAELAVGALAIENGTYLLMHNVALTGLDPERFDMPLHVLARTADELEQTYASGVDEY